MDKAKTVPKKTAALQTIKKTITYQSENGPVKVPAHPKRVVVLSTFAGNVMSLGVNVVGVDAWSKSNPRFQDKLKDVEEVSEDNIEKIMELNPDLIIGLSDLKNVDKLKKNCTNRYIHVWKNRLSAAAYRNRQAAE
ncbi:hypothetical protein RWE15_12790 [Virgibacillus halophilus]|uniref:Fe/B12 periplasmic-binding domain-containing protein n=1 Tax=Tigheibacillus halophilus TaxID=361280 RepID=A0ABU5C727_9BACI|nr:hypothetical protein [Virgibacillus halophilus]